MKRNGLIVLLLMLGLGLSQAVYGQEVGYVKGRVKDSQNKPVEDVVIEIVGQEKTYQTASDESGNFSMTLPAGQRYTLAFRHINYAQIRREVRIRPGATEQLPVVMKDKDVEVGAVDIIDENDPKGLPGSDKVGFQLFPIDPKKVSEIPRPKLDESVVTLLPGVAANNEFSSQYRVRGGNFDENLIYVNGIEVYRPFLIRSGQQEGLGFVNGALTENLEFSTGGFEAKYADKMSSVLDVEYRNPNKFHGSAEAGLLTQSLHLEGSTRNKEDSTRAGRFTYLLGARRFSTVYLLNSLDQQGDYRPNFADFQGLFTFSPKQKKKPMRIRERKNGTLDTIYYHRQRLKISTYLNFANNNYNFIPRAQETQFGTVQTVLRLRVAFEGRERMTYTTGLGAVTIDHKPNTRLKFKYIFTGFRTVESEFFTVEGGYFLSDVNTNFGNEGFNEVTFDRGIGTNFRNARNFLTANVFAAEQRADWFAGRKRNHTISWGLRGQFQQIDDIIDEWNGVDSAGYFELQETIKSEANLNSFLVKAYLQDNWKLNRHNTVRLVVGSRAVYNSLNEQVFFSPRAQLVYDPTAKKVNTDSLSVEEFRKYERQQYQLHFAAGMYHQPAFYREMRAFDGTLNTQLRAQTSIHFIAGADYLFKIWNRPFKFSGEGYYKILQNVIPYEIDNVRVRYYPNNIGKGYAYGVDLRVNGEFIRDVDSWVSLSVLSTKEDVPGDGRGFISRPSDQRFSFAMYFEDELPMNPTFKAHINFVYGSGLRIGPPRSLINRSTFTAAAYNRVDLGFSKVFYFNAREDLEGHKRFGLESLWISAEIYNLFQRANTVSYTWIKDVYNTQFAVPNFLSARLLNIRVMARF